MLINFCVVTLDALVTLILTEKERKYVRMRRLRENDSTQKYVRDTRLTKRRKRSQNQRKRNIFSMMLFVDSRQR